MPRSKKRKLTPKNIARKAEQARDKLKYAALLADHMRLMACAILMVKKNGPFDFTDAERKAIPPGTVLSIEKGAPGQTIVKLEGTEVSPIVGPQGEALAAVEGVRGAPESA